MQQLVAYGVDDLAPEDADTLPQFRAYVAFTNSVTADPVPSGSIDGETSGFSNEAMYPIRAYPSMIGSIVLSNGDQYVAYFLDGIPPGSAPTITTTDLDVVVPGFDYTDTIEATGGVGPFTWRIITGVLPPGLTFNADSLTNSTTISGNTTEADLYPIVVRIWDAFGQYDDQAYDFLVANRLQITPDTNAPLAIMFDSAENPKLLEINVVDLTVSAGAYSDTSLSARAPRFNFDLGGGAQTYEIPPALTEKLTAIGRLYLWRLAATPNAVSRIKLV